MHNLYRTQSISSVYDILSRDGVYDNLVYDNSPPLSHFIPNMKDNVWFILNYRNEPSGLIMFEYLNYVLWVPHIVILEEYRGNNSEEWGKQAIQYMINSCGAKKFLALTPYKSAKHYAERVGFKEITVLTKSIQKNGKLLDQYMLEMNT